MAENLPIISDEEHAQNLKRYEELRTKIDDGERLTRGFKTEKDAIEPAIYSYLQRKQYQTRFVEELKAGAPDENGNIAQYKKNNNAESTKASIQRKKRDNGIERAWGSGVTDPIADSRAAFEYARINGHEKNENNIDDKLMQEHLAHKAFVVKTILPKLRDDLKRRREVIELTYLPAFELCRCNENPDACLEREGSSVSEEFIEKFIGVAYDSAHQQALKQGIPLTRQELVEIAAENGITNEGVKSVNAKKEQLKRAMRSLRNGTNEETEELDIKDDQNDQGALSQ